MICYSENIRIQVIPHWNERQGLSQRFSIKLYNQITEYGFQFWINMSFFKNRSGLYRKLHNIIQGECSDDLIQPKQVYTLSKIICNMLMQHNGV
jgi:hypothetical protein